MTSTVVTPTVAGMTNPIGSRAATPEPRPPMIVTGRRLNDVLDARDEAMVDAMDRFKVEVVERMDAMARLQDQAQTLITQALAVIRINNIHQPQAESMEVKYFYEVNGWPYECSADRAAEIHAAGGHYFRDVTIRERFQADEGAVHDAAEVVAQLRSITR